jgi:undecaprenyl diphosphate synthase
VCALRRMMEEGISPDAVTAEMVGTYLFTAGTPDPDLIIRTSGEMRVSNFLIWQGAYSEWYVTPKYWPDFKKEELRLAIINYGQRNRRFGRLSAHEPTDYDNEESQTDVG